MLDWVHSGGASGDRLLRPVASACESLVTAVVTLVVSLLTRHQVDPKLGVRHVSSLRGRSPLP